MHEMDQRFRTNPVPGTSENSTFQTFSDLRRMSLMGRQRTIALHKVNVRYLEVAWGFAKFSAFFLVFLTGNHKADGQI